MATNYNEEKKSSKFQMMAEVIHYFMDKTGPTRFMFF